MFGQRSEKVLPLESDEQIFFEGFEELAKPEEVVGKIPAHERRKQKKKGEFSIEVPEDLPVERHLLDLEESEKRCPDTGKELIKIGEEITRKLAYKPASFYI